MSWLVIIAKPNCEYAAEEDLAPVAGYCPKRLVRRRPRKMHGRTILRPMPRFPGYLFAADDQAGVAALIRRSSNLRGFIRLGEGIGRVEDEVVAALKAADMIPPDEPQPLRLVIGDRVVIAGGPLEGKSGEVVRVAGDNVGVNLLGSRFRTSVRSIDLVRDD